MTTKVVSLCEYREQRENLARVRRRAAAMNKIYEIFRELRENTKNYTH